MSLRTKNLRMKIISFLSEYSENRSVRMFEVAVLIQFSKSSVSSLGTGRDDVPGSFLCHGDEDKVHQIYLNGH